MARNPEYIWAKPEELKEWTFGSIQENAWLIFGVILERDVRLLSVIFVSKGANVFVGELPFAALEKGVLTIERMLTDKVSVEDFGWSLAFGDYEIASDVLYDLVKAEKAQF